MFKKTAIAALVLGFSGAASAAMYAPAPAPACAAGNVTVPCESTAWDLGVQALYLKAEHNARENDITTVGTTGASNDYSTDWGWGFRLEGSYHFGTGNDLNLNWLYYKSDQGSRTASTTNPDGTYLESKYNIVNLEMGQHVDFGESWDVRMHGGLQYANLKQDVAPTASTVPNTTTYERQFEVEGLGPRAGVDVAYDFGNGFALTSNAAAALLVAEDKLDGTVKNAAGVSTNSSVKNNRVVSDLEGKVGVRYTHAMAQGDLMIDLGYQAQNFNTSGYTGDIGLHGGYLGLKWVGNA